MQHLMTHQQVWFINPKLCETKPQNLTHLCSTVCHLVTYCVKLYCISGSGLWFRVDGFTLKQYNLIGFESN